MLAKQDQSNAMDEQIRIGEEFKKAFIGDLDGKGDLAKKIANALLEKTAQMIDNEVTCKTHNGLPLVAFDMASSTFGCQQCIYDGPDSEPEFITLKARELHDRFK